MPFSWKEIRLERSKVSFHAVNVALSSFTRSGHIPERSCDSGKFSVRLYDCHGSLYGLMQGLLSCCQKNPVLRFSSVHLLRLPIAPAIISGSSIKFTISRRIASWHDRVFHVASIGSDGSCGARTEQLGPVLGPVRRRSGSDCWTAAAGLHPGYFFHNSWILYESTLSLVATRRLSASCSAMMGVKSRDSRRRICPSPVARQRMPLWST